MANTAPTKLKRATPLIFVLIFNLWLFKIFQIDFSIGVLTVLATVALYYKKLTLTLPLVALLLFFQYKTSAINSLTFLNEHERTLQIERMHGYPPGFYRWANWLEARPEALIFYKLEANLKEVIDPNLYFFANHPRERVGVVEYEKFAYVLFPFFVLGIFSVKRQDLKILFLALTPLVLISIIGNSTVLGPFSLFPFIAANISEGLGPVFARKKYLLIFLIIFVLVFVQTVAYATH